MGDVSVTVESLKNVKKSLTEFQTQVCDVVTHVSNHSELVLNKVKASLKKQREFVEKLIRIKNQIQTETEECQKNIDSLTKAVQQKKAKLSGKNSEDSEEVQKANNELSEAEALLAQRKRRKMQLETELDTVKKEIQKEENKEERLKSAGNEVEKNIQKLNSKMKNFRQQALTSNESNSSGIDRCIQFIEEYEQMNLSN